LTGDFDEDSAHELLNMLKKPGNDYRDIFIDTNNLKTIQPFDRDVFQKNLNSIKKQLKNLKIIGANKYKITQD
jgi:hypothetical protein